jgi:hypothetical protein
MSRLKAWLKSKYNQFMRSKFLVFVLGLAIGSSMVICFYEGMELKTQYDQSMKIWEEHLVNKASAKSNGEEVSEYYRASETSAQVAENVKGQTSASSIKELADKIHFMESTNGTAKVGLHITCKNRGLSNEYGYNPPTCYKDYNTVRKIVEDWIQSHREQGMSDAELLNHYSNNAY